MKPDRRKFAIVRNGKDIIAVFGSHILAEEAYWDLGCYLDRAPSPDDFFEVKPLPLLTPDGEAA